MDYLGFGNKRKRFLKLFIFHEVSKEPFSFLLKSAEQFFKKRLVFPSGISTFKRKIKSTLKTVSQIIISESCTGKSRGCTEDCGNYMSMGEKEKYEKKYNNFGVLTSCMQA